MQVNLAAQVNIHVTMQTHGYIYVCTQMYMASMRAGR